MAANPRTKYTVWFISIPRLLVWTWVTWKRLRIVTEFTMKALLQSSMPSWGLQKRLASVLFLRSIFHRPQSLERGYSISWNLYQSNSMSTSRFSTYRTTILVLKLQFFLILSSSHLSLSIYLIQSWATRVHVSFLSRCETKETQNGALVENLDTLISLATISGRLASSRSWDGLRKVRH